MLTPCHGVALRRRTPPCTPRALCVLVEGVATWLLCFFAGEAHAAPLHPPRPQSGIGTGVVVCRVCWWRVMCRKSSPAAAFSGDSRDLICATLATSGEVSPVPSRRRATLAGFCERGKPFVNKSLFLSHTLTFTKNFKQQIPFCFRKIIFATFFV